MLKPFRIYKPTINCRHLSKARVGFSTWLIQINHLFTHRFVSRKPFKSERSFSFLSFPCQLSLDHSCMVIFTTQRIPPERSNPELATQKSQLTTRQNFQAVPACWRRNTMPMGSFFPVNCLPIPTSQFCSPDSGPTVEKSQRCEEKFLYTPTDRELRWIRASRRWC